MPTPEGKFGKFHGTKLIQIVLLYLCNGHAIENRYINPD